MAQEFCPATCDLVEVIRSNTAGGYTLGMVTKQNLLSVDAGDTSPDDPAAQRVACPIPLLCQLAGFELGDLLKQMARAQDLLNRYPIISDQIKLPALGVVLGGLEQVLESDVEGEVVEFGCYIGTTSLFIRRLLDAYDQSDKRLFYAYDSFEGLPPKSEPDASAVGVDFKAGELAVSKKQFLHEFHKAKLKPPITHKAWFKNLRPDQLPDQIAFAFLDGDFYESIRDSLALVWPRLAQQGIIAIDDYKRETLPGVERAVREYIVSKPVRLTYSNNIALIQKSRRGK